MPQKESASRDGEIWVISEGLFSIGTVQGIWIISTRDLMRILTIPHKKKIDLEMDLIRIKEIWFPKDNVPYSVPYLPPNIKIMFQMKAGIDSEPRVTKNGDNIQFTLGNASYLTNCEDLAALVEGITSKILLKFHSSTNPPKKAGGV